MNTIRRPRRHPRVRSINFRVFRWLLVRVAAYEILSNTLFLGERRFDTQYFVAKETTDRLLELGRRYLDEYNRLRRAR